MLIVLGISLLFAFSVMIIDIYGKRLMIITATVMECDDQNKTGCKVLATDSSMRELKPKNTSSLLFKSY